MKPASCLGRAACSVLACVAMVQPTAAAVQTLFVDTLASATVAPTLQVGDTLFVDTLVRGQTGPLSQSVNFHVGAGVTGLSGLAAWATGSAAGTGPRLIGVNVDIFNSANQLVASDAFVNAQGGFASSAFSSLALTEGDYRLVASGTAVRDSMFEVALSFAGIAQGTPSVSSGGLPVQGPNAAEPTVFFRQLQDTRTITSTLMAGDGLLIDSLVTEETGLLVQTTAFTVGQGVTGVNASIAWMLTAAGDLGPRLIGVNVDIFDDHDSLVMSDAFEGLAGGLAHSTLAGSLGPGHYTLRITGTGARASSIDVALSFTGTAEPPPNPVSESGSAALSMAALVGLAVASRRRRGATTFSTAVASTAART